MTFQAPIFNSGLIGKANEFVCNAWTDASRSVSANAEGIEWAQRQVLRQDVPERWLAKLTAATQIAANRWSYDFVQFAIDQSNLSVVVDGTFGTGSGAINLRELANTATTVDGSALNGSTIGPVGSKVYNGNWMMNNLEGFVEMHSAYKTDGSVLFWFSSPNPVNCQ